MAEQTNNTSSFIPGNTTHEPGGALADGEEYSAAEIEVAERMARSHPSLSLVSVTSIALILRRAGV